MSVGLSTAVALRLTKHAQGAAFLPEPLQCRLADRKIVQVAGKDALPFLQGLLTNDVRPLEVPGEDVVYGALLTPKGKFLSDLFVSRNPGSPGSFFLDVGQQSHKEVLQWLTKYKLRRPVVVEDASSDLEVWVRFPGPPLEGSSAGWAPDPRLPDLGWRSLFSTSGGPKMSHGTAEEYRYWRYLQGVAEGVEEVPGGRANPLEFNLDQLHGVSYTKGCYIGQERNSFTHYRGVIRRRLLPLRVEGGHTGAVAVGEAIVKEGDPTSLGTLCGVCHDLALAHMRLSPALLSMEGKAVLRGAESGLQLAPWRPHWWPPEWGTEEGLDGGP